MKEANDDKNKRLKLTNQVSVRIFFKTTEKIHEINTSGNQAVSAQKINEVVNYVSDCPLFASLNDPRFKYDIGPILEPGAKITLTDGAKFQMLTSRDYLPSSFKFPPNKETPSRQWSHQILNLYDFSILSKPGCCFVYLLCAVFNFARSYSVAVSPCEGLEKCVRNCEKARCYPC